MRSRRLSVSVAVFTLLSSSALWSAPTPWILEIDSIDAGVARLENVVVSNLADSGQPQQVNVEILSIRSEGAESEFGPFSLSCPGDLTLVASNACEGGSWNMPVADGLPELQGNLQNMSFDNDQVLVATNGRLGDLYWTAEFEASGSVFAADLRLPGQSFEALGFIKQAVPEFAWINAGEIEGSVRVSGDEDKDTQIQAQLEFSGIDFDSPEGLYAGLGIGVTISAQLGQRDDGAIVVEGQLSAGELLLMDFYRDFSDGALDFGALMALRESSVEVKRLSVRDDGALQIVGQASIPLRSDDSEVELVLREFQLNFPEAYSRYLEPIATVYGLDGLATRGKMSWTGDWSPGSARSGVLRLEQLSVGDAEHGRFSINELDGTLRTGSESRLSWSAASFEKINLGAGEAVIALTPETISLTKPLTIDVFGGLLELEALSFGLPRNGEPDIQLQAAIDDIEVLQLSRAIGWPEFGGTLSGKIPAVNWSGGVIEIDGALDFEVFDGQLMLTDLRVERPFGVLPSLSANITATGLDLEELTHTFEFGRIAGRADGYIRNLRMLDWQPVQFEAWFGTPVTDDRKHDISRQAVSHLTTLGGGSATAMLTGPVLRLFNNFSYRRLGLGCVLQNNVCRISGIKEQGEAVLLLEGAGIPKISILAYNRAVDWPQLLAELSAVTGGEDIRVGD
jgi:hypothetical protein